VYWLRKIPRMDTVRPMTDTLRAVGAAVDLDLKDRVRLVARMLLAMHPMTQLELGRQLGLPATPIRNRLQGRTPFTVDEIGRMTEIFGVSPEVFFAGPSALIRAGQGAVSVRKLPSTARHPDRTPTGPAGRRAPTALRMVA
jgi:hypothetical protein